MFQRMSATGLAVMCVVLSATSAWGTSLTGKWSGQQGTVTYQQDGNSVTGYGTLPNGEAVDLIGVMLGNKVHYSYSRSSGGFGVGTMTLSKDGNTLESTYFESTSGTSGQWQLTRDKVHQTKPAEPAQLARKWNSNMGPAEFEQTGADVIAKVTFVNAHTAQLTGKLDGRTLEFTYELGQGGGGTGNVTLSDDGTILQGTYTDAQSGEGELVMVRPGPVPCGLPDPPATE